MECICDRWPARTDELENPPAQRQGPGERLSRGLDFRVDDLLEFADFRLVSPVKGPLLCPLRLHEAG